MTVMKTLSEELLKKHQRLQADISTLSKEIEKVRNFRNGMAHCFLVQIPDPNGKLAVAVRRKNNGNTKIHPDAEMIKNLAGKIQQARAVQLQAQKVTDSLKALRGKFR